MKILSVKLGIFFYHSIKACVLGAQKNLSHRVHTTYALYQKEYFFNFLFLLCTLIITDDKKNV